MADLADVPFFSLNDDDLSDLFNSSSTKNSNANSSIDTAYNLFVANNINSLTETFNLQPDNNEIPCPLSDYATESQF